MGEIDITFDQLISDLSFCRGKRLSIMAKALSMAMEGHSIVMFNPGTGETKSITLIDHSKESEEEKTKMNDQPNQAAKADLGKARLTLVPRQILYDIARIREYGNQKYHDPDNWKTVEEWRFKDAMMRHMCAYLDDPDGVDEESGLPHLWHLACNVAFLCEFFKLNGNQKNQEVTEWKATDTRF